MSQLQIQGRDGSGFYCSSIKMEFWYQLTLRLPKRTENSAIRLPWWDQSEPMLSSLQGHWLTEEKISVHNPLNMKLYCILWQPDRYERKNAIKSRSTRTIHIKRYTGGTARAITGYLCVSPIPDTLSGSCQLGGVALPQVRNAAHWLMRTTKASCACQ